ncbi:hypothetical protein DPEC_G00178560 [Dallia pectoralis]|uniref:Uncharacterized protein n=1 Tax=Dallia pectoralis TaxID=75939 RepID=A0ACC2GF68_DALPE|nr:hypothetical protein DPEC_G00178560 [Dallia pectoralis]
MAESNFEDEMEERYFEDLLRGSDVCGCLYEPQYSETQLRLTEEQEAAAAEERSLPGGHEEEPVPSRAGADCWCQCSRCAPMDTGRVPLLLRISAMPFSS